MQFHLVILISILSWNSVTGLNFWGTVGNKSFYGGDALVPWNWAVGECRNFGMDLVRFDTDDEYEFAFRSIINDESRGPSVWLGAKSIGQKETYVWSDSITYPAPDAKPLGDFVNFYYYVEQGSMALVLSPPIIGSSVYGVHTEVAAAKALCQRVSSSE